MGEAMVFNSVLDNFRQRCLYTLGERLDIGIWEQGVWPSGTLPSGARWRQKFHLKSNNLLGSSPYK